MGRDLAAAFAAAREVFGEVDEVLGQRLSKLMFEGPAEELTLTENAQPALMALSMAVVRVLAAEGGVQGERGGGSGGWAFAGGIQRAGGGGRAGARGGGEAAAAAGAGHAGGGGAWRGGDGGAAGGGDGAGRPRFARTRPCGGGRASRTCARWCRRPMTMVAGRW